MLAGRDRGWLAGAESRRALDEWRTEMKGKILTGWLIVGCCVVMATIPAWAESPQRVESPQLKKSSSRERLNIHIDSPSFRPMRVVVPQRNVFSGYDKTSSEHRKTHSSLKRFAGYLKAMLELSGVFEFHALPFYGPPLFPWPEQGGKSLQRVKSPQLVKSPQRAKSSSKGSVDLSLWLKSRPRVKLAQGQKLDIAVMVSVKIVGEKLSYTLEVVDFVTYTVRLSKSYQISMSGEKSMAYDFVDALLQLYTGKIGVFSSRIVFIGKKSAKSSKQVYTVRIDGSDLQQITFGNSIHLSPSWSSDGKHIFFTSYRSGDPDLYSYNLASKRVKSLSAARGVDSGGQGDPQSRLVVFSGVDKGDTDIYVTSLKGGPRRLLIRGSGLDVDPTFSPNGKWLAFVSGRYGNPHIFLADLARSARGKLRVISDKRLTWAGWYNGNPSFSPDSLKIAFAGYDKETNRFDIFMMDPTGKNLERLTLKSGDNESPSWSPNGQLLVFHSNRIGVQDKKGQPALYLMRRDGSRQRRIPIPLYSAQTPKWGPAVR